MPREPLLQQLYKRGRNPEAAWEAARAAVEQVGGDIRVCEKQIASCEAEQKKGRGDGTAERRRRPEVLCGPSAAGAAGPAPGCWRWPRQADKPAPPAAQAAEKAQARLDDALTAYLTGTLEPAQKAYNEHYVCDYPLGLAGWTSTVPSTRALCASTWNATPPVWSRPSKATSR